MRAGTLRNKVTIQVATEAQGDSGEITSTWATFAEVWAAIEPIKGAESFRSQHVHAEATTQIRIRYLASVTTKMRVLFGTRIFKIESIVDPKERIRELMLMCVEEV